MIGGVWVFNWAKKNIAGVCIYENSDLPNETNVSVCPRSHLFGPLFLRLAAIGRCPAHRTDGGMGKLRCRYRNSGAVGRHRTEHVPPMLVVLFGDLGAPSNGGKQLHAPRKT